MESRPIDENPGQNYGHYNEYWWLHKIIEVYLEENVF